MTANASEIEMARSGAPDTGRTLDLVIALLALVGLIDASYLTIQHLSGSTVICVATAGCDAVLMSKYATLPGGVPLAGLGAVAYFSLFSFSTLSAFGYGFARALVVPLVLIMFGASLCLLYLQAFVLHAFCTYCLLSAAISTVLATIVFVRMFRDRRSKL